MHGRTSKNLPKTAAKHGLLPHGDYIANMCRISIPAILDVIWGQTNLFPASDRTPNPLSRKDRNSKNLILMDFALHQKPLYNAVKYLVRKATHKQKFGKAFSANSISASSYWILMTSISKNIYFTRSKRL